jgi:hypothetical protein
MAGGWFVLREKYCWLVADKPSEQGVWSWVVLFTVLLSASTAYSAKNPPKPQEGQCRYDLTSIAALSCMQKDSVRPSPATAG